MCYSSALCRGIAEIMAFLDGLPYGYRRVQSGLILRQAKFLNSILYNSESWHGVTIRDIIKLERIDNALLRKIIGAHSKTPVEFLFLETATLTIRYILASRRINYLKYILQKKESDLLQKFYNAQKMTQSKVIL